MPRSITCAGAALVIGTTVSGFALAQQASLAVPSASSAAQNAQPAVPSRFPPGCAVSLREGRNDIRFLPRAGLEVANHLSHPVRLFIQERAEVGAGESDLGTIEAGETKLFVHSLLAGRNVVHAVAIRDGKRVRIKQQVMYITNSGALTCRRKFVWPIQVR